MTASALALPPSDGKDRFADVSPDAWYAGAVNAMADMGFVSGYEDGTFRPEASVSFQEMAVILNKVAAWASMDGYDLDREDLTVEEWGAYYNYADWARTAVRNLDKLGALAGGLAPADPGTREAAAAMLCRLMESIHLIWD